MHRQPGVRLADCWSQLVQLVAEGGWWIHLRRIPHSTSAIPLACPCSPANAQRSGTGASLCSRTGAKRGRLGGGRGASSKALASGGGAKVGGAGGRYCRAAACRQSDMYSILPQAAQIASQVRQAFSHCARQASGTSRCRHPKAKYSRYTMLCSSSQWSSAKFPPAKDAKRGESGTEAEEALPWEAIAGL